jgi:hypothetical protein
MKTIGKFTQLEHDFIVKVSTMETNSNYNTFAHVFHKGEKQSMCGTSFKDGTPNDQIIEWAKKAVGYMQTEEFVNSLFEDVKGKPKTAEEEYPELNEVAKVIAQTIAIEINNTISDNIPKTNCPYPAQCLLEMVIKKLEEAV